MPGRSYGAASRWTLLRSLGLAVRTALRPGAPSLAERAAALPRLVRATLDGRFPGISRGRLFALLGALAYVISPVDLVPEGMLSVFGLADDAMVVSWLAAALVNHTEDFLAWERGLGAAEQPGGPSATGQQAAGSARPGPFDTVQDTVQSYVVQDR